MMIIMKDALLKFIEKFNIIDRSMELFEKNFDDYKDNYADEFNQHFKEFDRKNFEITIKTISFNLGYVSNYNHEYVSIDIEMRYHQAEIGYNYIYFDMEGNYEDDYFVIY